MTNVGSNLGSNLGSLDASREAAPPERRGWSELYLKEDWWAVWLGLALMVFAIVLFQAGSSNIIQALAINPGGLKWTSLSQLADHFAKNAQLYLYQFLFWIVLFGATTAIMGVKLKEFVPAFIVLYIGALVMFAIAGWATASQFNLEAPLVALILGLVIANVFRLPRWMYSPFRVKYYMKPGILPLGPPLPIALVLTAGPVAIVQATVISLVTCLVIYFVATRVFGLEKTLAAVMGVGGAVCGVSA